MSETERVETLWNWIEHCQKNNLYLPDLPNLRFLVWFDGLQKRKLQLPLYTDAVETMKNWRYKMNIPLYILASSGFYWIAVKWFLTFTSHGNLSAMFTDVYEQSNMGNCTMTENYQQLCAERLLKPPENVMFITHTAEVAKAAKLTKMEVIMCATTLKKAQQIKDGLAECQLPIIRTFSDIQLME